MRIYNLLMMFALGISFSACGNTDEATTDNAVPKSYFKNTTSVQDSKNDIYTPDNSGILVLDSNANFQYMDIDTVDVNITDTNVKIELSLVNLPDTLLFNKTATRDNSSEYYWSISFDIDDDNKNSVDDLEFSISHVKFSGSSEVNGTILSNTQQNVYETFSRNSETSKLQLHDISSFVSIVGNTIIFDIPKTFRRVDEIKSGVGIKISTYASIEGKSYFDGYPNFN